MKRVIVALLALVPAFSANAFEPTGEIFTRLSHVKFDDRQVIGPRVSMSRRSDGTWGGWLRGRPLDFSVTETAIQGVNLSLTIERTQDYLVLRGYYEGQPIHVE